MLVAQTWNVPGMFYSHRRCSRRRIADCFKAGWRL